MAQQEGVVGKKKLQDLAAEVCPRQLLDEDTEEVGLKLYSTTNLNPSIMNDRLH